MFSHRSLSTLLLILLSFVAGAFAVAHWRDVVSIIREGGVTHRKGSCCRADARKSSRCGCGTCACQPGCSCGLRRKQRLSPEPLVPGKNLFFTGPEGRLP